MFNNNEFYPTPSEVIDRMLSNIDLTKINTVLEPSAGKGDIAKMVIEKHDSSLRYRSRKKLDIDVIEIDEKLQHILKGENLRVIHNDFLTFQTYKSYDLIILNPPFSNGEKHLLKAIELQQNGGTIVCLLNAETIRNPYSNSRKDLIRKLDDYNAKVEFLESSFAEAERKTLVEIALIRLDIPKMENSIILENLKREENFDFNEDNWGKDLVISDFIKRIVQQYNFEVKAGTKLINEFHNMSPYFLKSFKENKYSSEILSLTVDGDNDSHTREQKINSFIQSVRYKYWYALFQSEQFNKLFTSNLRQEYYNKIRELVDYDFSLYNIYQIQEDISKSLLQSVEDTIINLFEELSHKYHWHPETGNNIHYYNGWKTNESWKINKRVIIPLNAFSTWDSKFECDYKVIEKLSDIEKALSYLDGGINNHDNLIETLELHKKTGNTKKINLNYFMVTFYKKGTCHIQFTNQDLLSKFNLYGSRKKGWLPPSYGHKPYTEMNEEERSIIDDFQGYKDYERVMSNRDYFLSDHPQLDKVTEEKLLLIG